MARKKIGFLLNPIDGWPPHEVEHIWLEDNENGYYIVKNFPFYIIRHCFRRYYHN